jgi:hypothetical protein
MFTRDEALAVWDDLNNEKDSFLYAFGELVLSKNITKYPSDNTFGYFIRARNFYYNREMFEAFNKVCEKHNCTYRFETDTKDPSIIFYKEKKDKCHILMI